MAFSGLKDRHNENIRRVTEIKERIQTDPHNIALCQSSLNKAYKYIKGEMFFYYNHENNYLHPFFEDLIAELNRAEISTTFSTFILPDSPKFDYQKAKQQQFNKENDEDILNSLIEYVWYEYAMIYTYSYPKTLKDTSFVNNCAVFATKLCALCEEFSIECYEICINPGFLSSASLYGGCKFHYACIIKLNSGYYLIDPSYRQFFLVMNTSLERIGIPLIDGVTPGAFMVLNPERKALAQSLITKGYIKLTDKSFKDYCDGFAMSFRNGLYYKMNPYNPYKTDYTADDYKRFLKGEDNQVNHEGYEALQRQRRPY